LQPPNVANNRTKFATYHRDDTGIDYADQRYYVPGTGRFRSADPLDASADPGSPSSWNRYAYVGGDPINANDPSGMIMSAITSSGVCPVGAGESKVYVPCMLLQIYDNNPNEALAAEWDNLSDECQKGLRGKYGQATIKSMMMTLNRVVALMDTIEEAASANGIDPALLAAIALKETNGENRLQRCEPGLTWGDPKCSGAGMFQIDLHHNPGVSKDQALDVSFAADWAAKLLKTNMTFLASKHPNFTGDVLLQATAASFNLGRNGFSGNPDTIDVGSAGTPKNGYGANVIQLAECFR
jgi:RHS repeat-associated protein